MKSVGAQPTFVAGFLCTIVVLLGFSMDVAAQSGLISYRLEFSRTGRSVNYPQPQDGYLVVDLGTGSVSSVIVLRDPDTDRRYHTTGLISGRYFTVTSLEDGQVNDVVAGGAGAGFSDTAMLQVSGKVSSRFSIGGGERVVAAKRMVGFLLLAAADAVAVEDEDDTATTTLALGYLGSARVTARFAESDTKNLNNNDKSSGDAISAYSEWFTNQGIPAGSGDTPDFPTPVIPEIPAIDDPFVDVPVNPDDTIPDDTIPLDPDVPQLPIAPEIDTF